MLAETTWHVIDATGTVTVLYADGTEFVFRIDEDADGMWPLVNYTPHGLHVRFTYAGRETFIPWAQVKQVHVRPDA